MMYMVLRPFKAKIANRKGMVGEMQINAGTLVKLSDMRAAELLAKDKIKPYCHWLERTVNICEAYCFGMEWECCHFKGYWAEKLNKNI